MVHYYTLRDTQQTVRWMSCQEQKIPFSHHQWNQQWRGYSLLPQFYRLERLGSDLYRGVLGASCKWPLTWAALFGSLASFWLIVPILQLVWILSRGGNRIVGVHMQLGLVRLCLSLWFMKCLLMKTHTFILNLLHFFRKHQYNMYIEINIKLAVFGGLIELSAHLLLVGINNAATW